MIERTGHTQTERAVTGNVTLADSHIT